MNAITRIFSFGRISGKGVVRRWGQSVAIAAMFGMFCASGFISGRLAGIASAGELQDGPPAFGPALAAASNFGQGLDRGKLDAALALGVRDFRDAVYWRDVEQAGGVFVFEGRQAWPDLLAQAGARMSLTVNNSHPDYDNGTTPHTREGRAAFARFAAAAVERFPAIEAIEVGNEMNSDTFVSGPWRIAALPDRARLYAQLVLAVRQEVQHLDRPVRVIGGAAHSVPLAWLSDILDAGAGEAMDALALHPYTTAPEQLVRQVALLRRLPGLEDMPIEVTEFGYAQEEGAAGHMMRSYCQMALAGVRRAAWYPLGARGDGFAPLLAPDGTPTPAGRSFMFISEWMVGQEARSIAAGPFTYGCGFGRDVAVLWGMPRTVTLDPGLRAMTLQGDPLDPGGLRLSEDVPLVVIGEGRTPAPGQGITLGPSAVLADSFHQFAFPEGDGNVPEGGFHWLSRIDGTLVPLETRPGQEKGGAPWMPYLGSGRDGMLRAGPDWALPSSWGADRPLEVVLRHVAPVPVRARLALYIAPKPRSVDGVTLEITLGGATLLRQRVTGPGRIALPGLELGPDRQLDIVIGPGDTARGDVTELRATLLRER